MNHCSPWGLLRRLFRRKTDPIDLLFRQAPRGLPLRTLVHVGAHLAQERHAYEACGFRDLLWIEASSRLHAELARLMEDHLASRRAAGITDLRHRTACALLADQEGTERVLREFSNDGMSNSIFGATETLHRRWPNVRETGAQERVRTRTLDGLLADLDFGPVDVLVVDVQGAELLVLRGATQTLSKVKAVVSEVSTQPLYQGGVLFAELESFLAGHGFEAMSLPRRHGDLLFVHPRRAGFGP